MTDAANLAAAPAPVAAKDSHIDRLNAALAAHHAVLEPLTARIKLLEDENAQMKTQIADYAASFDQTSAYLEETTAALTSPVATPASAPAPAPTA